MWKLFCFLFCVPIFAAPKVFTVKDLGSRNLFVLTLDGSIEKNLAMSRFVTGSLSFDVEKNREISGSWEIDLRTLDTQNEMRNLELREQILRIPEFSLLKVQLSPLSLAANWVEEKQQTFSSQVSYSYAGKNVPLKSQVKITYIKESPKSQQRLPGNLMKVQITQEWNLDAFGLAVPENLKMVYPKLLGMQTDFVGSDWLPTDKPIFPEAPKPR